MRPFVICATLLIALPALAQEPFAETPRDYSRDALRRFVADNGIKMSPLPEKPVAGIQWHIGWFEYRALGMQWRIFYLPVVPLAGSGMNNTAKIPNTLESSYGRPFPPSPQLSPDRSAAVNREMKRVLKLEREAALKEKP